MKNWLSSNFKKWKEIILKTFSKESIKNFLKKHKFHFLWAGIALIIILLLIPPLTYLYFASDLKDKNSIINTGKTGLTLLDRTGKPFYTFYQPKAITYVPLSQIPTSIQNAVIASEDKNFYTNPGFSIRGIARAFVADIFAGRIVEGGSTITQELVKNSFLNSSQSFLRKYEEIVLAAELNRRFSKQDILEMYLNSVYFGEGSFGVENASEAYFGKHASELDTSESALLVGLLPAPSAYSPLSNDPSIALRKRQIVLQTMVGEKYINQNQANTAAQEKPVYKPTTTNNSNTLAPHFALYVKNQIIQKYGEERVIRDGFQVTTTLDAAKQQYAETVVKNQVGYLKYDKASNGAAIALDPKTGEILVMVGSYDWNDPKFGQTNMAITPRQPGSSFKPLIYADALEQKLITPATVLEDVKTTFPGNYTPHDYDYSYRGPVTVRRALSNSLNIPAVEVMEKVGVPQGLSIAQKFGITTLGTDASKYGLSLVLGSGEVKLLELADAYAVFANQGTYVPTKSILSIKDKYGNSVTDTQSGILASVASFFSNLFHHNESVSETHSVISPETAFLISSILSDNRARAEEFGNALTISRTAAVKTGTTDDFRDALTIGYTPSLVVGVWVGNNDNTPMDNIAGSLGAAPIWRLMMTDFLANTPVEKFTEPDSIINEILCPSRANGYYATASAYTEFFIADTQPVSCGQPTLAISPSPTKSLTPTQKPTATSAPTQAPTAEPQPTATPQPIPSPTATLAPTIGTPTNIPLPTVQITP